METRRTRILRIYADFFLSFRRKLRFLRKDKKKSASSAFPFALHLFCPVLRKTSFSSCLSEASYFKTFQITLIEPKIHFYQNRQMVAIPTMVFRTRISSIRSALSRFGVFEKHEILFKNGLLRSDMKRRSRIQ
ncbi:MAG: hypothetical protein RLZZ628_4486, partial [Bacteroidota bacterium]